MSWIRRDTDAAKRTILDALGRGASFDAFSAAAIEAPSPSATVLRKAGAGKRAAANERPQLAETLHSSGRVAVWTSVEVALIPCVISVRRLVGISVSSASGYLRVEASGTRARTLRRTFKSVTLPTNWSN